ncbi:MAG: helicase-exonuclease AddAB subunit AddA, partial [Oscillospiraceae bacterium]
MGFSLTEDQRAVVENRGGGLLVSAAAGSGKTRVLVERLLSRVCDEGRDISEFLVITFTNAAAAELRGRIVEELGKRLAADPGNRHLRRQTTLVYETQISTIHAFCTSLLRECGHFINLDPDFRLCDEGEAAVLRLAVLDDVMEGRYDALTPTDPFGRLLDLMSAGRDDSRLTQIAMDIYGKVQSHPQPEQWLREQRDAFLLSGVTDAGETLWGKLILEDAHRQAVYVEEKLREAYCLARTDGKLYGSYCPSLEKAMGEFARLAAASRQSWDAATKARITFPRLGAVRNCEAPAIQEKVKAVWADCKKRMKKPLEALADSSEELLEDLRTLAPAVGALFDLVTDYGRAYRAEKLRRGLLDFSDLEHDAVALLLGEDGKPTDLARQVGARYCEIMVDEYQDTNAVQNAIFTALSQEGQNLFMVGDVKQSIYRFRLADPGIFLGKYRKFPLYTAACEGEPRKIVLSQNFRSRSAVLEGVNYLFRNLMSEAFGEMDYGDAEALVPGGVPMDTGSDDSVELRVLNLENIADNGEGKTDKNLLEARCVAQRIRQLLDQNFLVSGETAPRPVRPSDMVILLRSPGSVLHYYAQALQEAGIPWQAEAAGEFFETTEVSVALSLLQIVDNPHQDVPLVAVLRSPVYGFSPDRLAEIRAGCDYGDFFTALTQDEGADSAAFCRELSELRFGAGDKHSYELLWDIYEETNLLGVFAAMDGGEERKGNLLALYEYARRFEAGGHKGLFGFLTHLNRLQESGKALAGPKTAAGSGVRMMSIHRSKGLEYPVVFLCGLGRLLNREDTKQPMLFHPALGVGPKFLNEELRVEYPTLARRAVALKVEQEMMAEELRILYVAMTRAKEKLILSCTVASGGADLAKLAPDVGCPIAPQALAGANSVGQWILTAALARPDAQCLRDACALGVPAVRGDFGPPWTIRYLDGQDYEVGMDGERDDGDATEDGDGNTAAATEQEGSEADISALRAKFSWQYPFRACCDIPSKLTATQLKGRNLDREAAEETERERSAEET